MIYRNYTPGVLVGWFALGTPIQVGHLKRLLNDKNIIYTELHPLQASSLFESRVLPLTIFLQKL